MRNKIEKLVLWLIRKLIIFWDRDGDKLTYSFGKDENTDYTILVGRYYKDHFTYGTKAIYYEDGGP